MNRNLTWLLAFSATAVLSLPINVAAEPIEPGFDLFRTKSGEITLENLKQGPVKIPLKGIPINQNPMINTINKNPQNKNNTLTKNNTLKGTPVPGLGNTDTIIKRKDGLKEGKIGEIPIKLVALSLMSVDPVPLGKKGEFNAYVQVDPTKKSKGKGTLKIKSHDDKPGGDGFHIPFLDVFLQVDLIPIEGNDSDPIREFVDVPGMMSSDGPWSHQPESDYPTIPNLPPGNYYPIGPFGITNGVFLLSELLPAQVPEPLTVALFGTGLLLVGVGRVRRSVG